MELLPSDIVGVLVSLDPKVYWRVAALSKEFSRRVRVGLPPMRAKKLFLRKKVKTERSRGVTFYKLPNGNVNGVVAKTVEMMGDVEYWNEDEDFMRPMQIYPADGPRDMQILEPIMDEPAEVDLLTTNELTAQQLDGVTNINDDVSAQLHTNGPHDELVMTRWPGRDRSLAKTTLRLDDFVINNELIYGVNINDYSKLITRPRKEVVYALNGMQIYRRNERPAQEKRKYIIDNVMIVCQDVSVMMNYCDGLHVSIVYNHKGILIIEHETAFGYSLNVLTTSRRRRIYDIDYKTSNIYRIARDSKLSQRLCMIFTELMEADMCKSAIMKVELKKLCRENGWSLVDVSKKRAAWFPDANVTNNNAPWEDTLLNGSGFVDSTIEYTGEPYASSEDNITDGEPMFESSAEDDIFATQKQGLM